MRKYFLLLFILIPISSWAGPTVLRFVTFEAPPHIGENLPDKGAAICALTQTFQKMNFKLELTFAPLKRAKILALKGADIVGYFPSSPYDIDPGFEASNPLLESPWVIVERKDKPIVWNSISDLIKYRGGTVSQYKPPTDISEMMRSGKMLVETAPDDALNLLKLVSKRIDYAFIDSTMFEYLVHKDPRLTPHVKNLRQNSKVVGMMPYYMVFKRTPTSTKYLKEFNSKFDQKAFLGLYKECMKKHLSI